MTRGWRVLAMMAVLVVAVGVVGATALPPVSFLRPPARVCMGKAFEVGVRDGFGLGARFHVIVRDPARRIVFERRGQAQDQWRTWRVSSKGSGGYRVLYSTGSHTRDFPVRAVPCDVIELSSNTPGGTAMLVSNMAPGARVESCTVVSYSTRMPATVRLYGGTTGTGLDRYLRLTVTRGTGTPTSDDSCSGFVRDAQPYVGSGRGVIFSGSLAKFPDSYAAGLVDPSERRPETWRNGESHAYRFSVTLVSDNRAQGLTAGQSFTWEARPL